MPASLIELKNPLPDDCNLIANTLFSIKVDFIITLGSELVTSAILKTVKLK